MRQVLPVAYVLDAPVVLRGGGTGNYGQVMPMAGGLNRGTTDMNAVLDIGSYFARAESGAFITDVKTALKPHDRELAMFPSTREIATVGGFGAGSSAGIGLIANRASRDPGIIVVRIVLSLEAQTKLHHFEEENILQIHHAVGLRGMFPDVTLRTVPTR